MLPLKKGDWSYASTPSLTSTHVASGVFEATIDGETQTLRQGDNFYIPTNVLHGAVCLGSGRVD